MSLNADTRYRDKITGVVGTATAVQQDETGAELAQLSLDPEYVEDGENPQCPKAANHRWYPEARLEAVS